MSKLETPITDATFKKQGWEKTVEIDSDDGEEFVYWTLPLPKDNPDGSIFCLISSINLDWEDMGLKKGQYIVELFNYGSLGFCNTEEQIEKLYNVLTGESIYEDK